MPSDFSFEYLRWFGFADIIFWEEGVTYISESVTLFRGEWPPLQ